MAEMVFDKIQLGRQSVVGTAVAATKIYPSKAEAPALDRGYRNPEEDWGRMGDEQPGRGAYGMRGGSTRITTDMAYDTFMDLFEMHAGAAVITGANPYQYVYTFDTTAFTTKYYTVEVGSETAQDQWQLSGCVVDELVWGFDALSAPGNAPWTLEASVQSLDRSINALTGSLSGPAVMETAEGHLTTLAEGSTATAFGSLSALTASLVSFKATSRVPFVRRIYGGASDIATGWGVSAQPGITFEAGIKVGSTAKTDIHDAFNAAGSVTTEKRWRITATGSGTKTIMTDARVRYQVVERLDRDGESIYNVNGTFVYDSTLASRCVVTGNGSAVATL
jgi:hypothetical protein